jgi:hypothetical protein
VPQDHRPRVDFHFPLSQRLRARLRWEPVGQPQPPPGRAGLEQRGGDLGADLGRDGGSAGRGRRNRTDRADQSRDPGRQHPDDLGQGGAHQVGRVGGALVPFEHGHDQARRLRGAERERRQPHPPSDLVAAVRPADRLDGQPRLAQDRDVAPGGALGDPKPVAETLRADARRVLDRLKSEQRPRRRAQLMGHRKLLPPTRDPNRGSRTSVINATVTPWGKPRPG